MVEPAIVTVLQDPHEEECPQPAGEETRLTSVHINQKALFINLTLKVSHSLVPPLTSTRTRSVTYKKTLPAFDFDSPAGVLFNSALLFFNIT